MNHDRNPINIVETFPVGKKMQAYVKDGMSNTMGLWDMEVMGIDLSAQLLRIDITQNWKGADTRGGQCWRETRVIKFNDLIIPLLPH